MFEDLDNIAVDLADTQTVRVALKLAQSTYTVRLLTGRDLNRAAAEADSVLTGLGLTLADRVGTRIEVTGSDPDTTTKGATATFVELERTRAGWQLNRIARRDNRRTHNPWLTTRLPRDTALALAATRVLRRGTDGSSRIHRNG